MCVGIGMQPVDLLLVMGHYPNVDVINCKLILVATSVKELFMQQSTSSV